MRFYVCVIIFHLARLIFSYLEKDLQAQHKMTLTNIELWLS